MENPIPQPHFLVRAWLVPAALILAAACRAPAEPDTANLALPDLAPIDRAGRPLQVVATTSIIGDVVANVGGAAIDLAVLLDPGVDSHSYQPTAQDLIAVEQAHVIFVNGWDLEGSLLDDLEAIGGAVTIVPISAGIVPLAAADHDHAGHADEGGRDHGEIDPHVWFDLQNVERWAANTAQVLGALDPQNAAAYAANAAGYQRELANLALDARTRLDAIPAENRSLVTNHDALGYFAHAYGFEVIATVIPAASTLAEPSAGDLAELVEEMSAHGVCTIFSETSVSDQLARTVAAELVTCGEVRVIPLYTEALGPPGSGADTFIGMYTANIDAILEGLKSQ